MIRRASSQHIPEPCVFPNSAKNICRSCFSEGMRTFLELRDFPVHSVLNLRTREKALNYPNGDISLAFCPQCGSISNAAFDAGMLEYSEECEESQAFSETFNEFSHNVAKYLIKKYNLYHKDILEIGCGKGDFLTLICELGENRGVGIDPAYVQGRDGQGVSDKVIFIQDFYSEKYASYKADFICCKMTLEHIFPTAEFVSMVRKAIGNRTDTIVFFQVPDAIRILRECAFEDIYYEHCSYFSPGSIARLFRNCGFDVLHLETVYNEQYLTIEAKPTNAAELRPLQIEEDIRTLESHVIDFPEKYRRKVSDWQEQLRQMRAKEQRVVLWGSGSKAVSFLTTFRMRDGIEYVVDINPHRQGTFMPGTGQQIVAPDFLKKYQPEVVIVMNAVYRKEIKRDLNRIGLTPKILTL